MGSEWSIWNGALGEEWKSWPSPCPLPCPPQIWNGTLGEEWKPDLQVTQQAPSLALFTILSLRNNLSKQQFIHLIDWFVIAQILTKKKKYETIEGIWAVKPFFYKFKHLFSFKILYRRLWGQIHKISLDTIVQIHLLLFPLLRLLCKYWLILYYCIATRQDRTFAASWTFGLPDWQCLPWEALDSVGTWNGQWVEFRTKAGTQIFWTHHNKTLIKKSWWWVEEWKLQCCH